jgi:hypothetical protein
MAGKLVNGVFIPYTPEEQLKYEEALVEHDKFINDLAWYELRRKRNFLLTSSDWVVTRSLEDGQPVPTDVVNFREALRVITVGLDDPTKVVWPPIPEIVAKSILEEPEPPVDPYLATISP